VAVKRQEDLVVLDVFVALHIYRIPQGEDILKLILLFSENAGYLGVLWRSKRAPIGFPYGAPCWPDDIIYRLIG
jgi:hypothetical protein